MRWMHVLSPLRRPIAQCLTSAIVMTAIASGGVAAEEPTAPAPSPASERAEDLAWIQDNWHVLWPAAQRSFEAVGRGAVVIDTTTTIVHKTGQGNPMFYLNEARIEQMQYPNSLRMVRGYNPESELVAMLLKSQQRVSTYRVLMPSARHH